MNDPAFLFYSSDFLTGTMTMTDEQVGKYIRLMCLQHQKGRLSEKDMLYICKSYDEDIFCKFLIDDTGKYYNHRLDDEVNKRKAYSESRKANRTAKTQSYDKDMSNICNTYVEHMENENENINDIDNNSRKDRGAGGRKTFTKPTIDEITSYCTERNNAVNPQKFLNYYESNGWRVGKNPMKDWKAAVRSWEQTDKDTPARKKPSNAGNFRGRDYGKADYDAMYEEVRPE